MIKSALNLFTNNLPWKLLSLACAVTLWFVVMNIYNPMQTKTFYTTLQIDNMEAVEENGYILQNEAVLKSRSVSFRVRASVKALNELEKNIKDLRAYIDLKPIDISRTEELDTEMPVTVKYELPPYLTLSNYTVLSWSPYTADIVLDKFVERDFPVKVRKDGEDTEGYVTLTPETVPGTVKIKGAKSDVDTIDAVRVVVDVSSATSDISGTYDIQVINKNGVQVTDHVELDISSVQVSIPVEKYAKISVLAPTITGDPADGFVFDSAEWSPKYVEVIGSEEAINSMAPVRLPTINIDNESAPFEKTFDMRPYFIDTNLSIRNGTPNEVRVRIELGREVVKELSVPIESLSISGMSLPFVLPGGEVSVTVKGTDEHIASLTDENTVGVIDLTGLAAGEHSVDVKFPYLPEGVVIAGEAPVITIEVLDEQTLEEPDEANSE